MNKKFIKESMQYLNANIDKIVSVSFENEIKEKILPPNSKHWKEFELTGIRTFTIVLDKKK